VATRRCGVCPTECSGALPAARRSYPSKKGDLSNVGTSEGFAEDAHKDERREGGDIGPEQAKLAVRYGKEEEPRKEEAMIEIFDHRPMLTALLALSTSVLVVVVITLSALLITSPQAASPASTSSGSNPAAPAPKVMDAGSYGEVYGYDIYRASRTGNSVERHHKPVSDYGN
jgi:hypothetical protein